jgi:Fur family transcriptional regulator, stress-responsive regulator
VDAERSGTLSSPDDLGQRIRAAGLRSTRQRMTVLEALDTEPGHLSADQLVAALVDRGTALPRSTVFNVLDDLVEAGLVLRADIGPGATRYESAGTRGRHHHFVCRSCGTIDDVPATTSLADLVSVVSDHRVESVEVVFRGLCRRCASRPD